MYVRASLENNLTDLFDFFLYFYQFMRHARVGATVAVAYSLVDIVAHATLLYCLFCKSIF